MGRCGLLSARNRAIHQSLIEMKGGGYNWLAPFYDALARVVVGKQIQQMQLKLLRHLHNRKKLLIIGGGTGWILPYIFRVNPTLIIHYVDASEKMLIQAQRNAAENKLIQFIKGTEAAIPAYNYDAVLTHFYLDLFPETQLTRLIVQLKLHLVKDALWLVSDFENQTWVHRLQTRAMYLFFRMVTNLRTNALPAWHRVLIQAGCVALQSAYSTNRFIRSVAFHVNIT
ncbi:MAG: class I SAM-dependent methyltransferase [Cyclobacteriaceae bacterium]|nr:class I SAM-dependent methyltransferase [Cyclobacteriaceae bacterium]